MTTVMTSQADLSTRTVQDLVAGGLSPEETLRHLDSYGIDWYITEQGTLMYRYWQIGAEGFVSPEYVARLQRGRGVPREVDALEWVSRNLADLCARYAGEWIAVSAGQVVAHAQTLPELMQRLHGTGIESPFITEIPAEPIVWATAYAR